MTRLVLIDDDPSYAENVRTWARQHSIDVFDTDIHKNLETAKTELTADFTQDKFPDFILLDYKFGEDETGLTLIPFLINHKKPWTRIIFLSNNLDSHAIDYVNQLGISAYSKLNFINQTKEMLAHEYKAWVALQRMFCRPGYTEQLNDINNSFRNKYNSSDDNIVTPVLIITPFPSKDDDDLSVFIDNLKTKLYDHKIGAELADSLPFLAGSVFSNVGAWLGFCAGAIAILYRRKGDTDESKQNDDWFNANVAFEIGFLSALGKPVLILNLQEDHLNIPADLSGIVYKTLSSSANVVDIKLAIKDWATKLTPNIRKQDIYFPIP